MSFYNGKKVSGTFERVVQKAEDFQPMQTDKLLRTPQKYSCQDSCSTLSKFSLDPHSSCYIKRTSSLDSLIENVPKPKRKYTRRKKLENVNTNNIQKRKYQRKPKHEHVNAVPYGNGCFHSSYSVSTPSLESDLDFKDFLIDDYKLKEERFIEELVMEQKKNALYNDIETVVINEYSDEDNTLAVPNYTKIPENIFSSPVKTKSEKDWLDYFVNCEEFIMESDLINDAYLPVTLDQNPDASVSALEHNFSFGDSLKDEINLYLIKDFSGIDIENTELTTFFESKSTQKKCLSENYTDCAFSENVSPNRFVKDQTEHASFNRVSEIIPNENISYGGNMKEVLNSEFHISAPPNNFVKDQIGHASFKHVSEMRKNENISDGGNMKNVLNSEFNMPVSPNCFLKDQIGHASFNHFSEMMQNKNISYGGNMKEVLNSEFHMSVSPNSRKSYEIIKAIDDELEGIEKSYRPKLETDVSSETFEMVISSNDLEEDEPLLTKNNMPLSKHAIDHTYNLQCNQEVHYDHSYFTKGKMNVDPEQLTDDIFEKIILNLVKLNFEDIEELQISQHIAADISEKFNITIASNNTSEKNNCILARHVINENHSGTSLEAYDVYRNEPFSNTFGKIDEVVITDTEDSNYDEYVVTDDVNTAVASLEVTVDNNLDPFNIVDNATNDVIHQNENMEREKIKSFDNNNKHSSLLKRKKGSKVSRNSNKYIYNRLEQVIKSILHKTELNQTEEFLLEVIKKVVNIFLRYCIVNNRQKRGCYKTISKNRLRRHCLPYRKSTNTFSKILSCMNQILKCLNRYLKNRFVSNLEQTKGDNNDGNVGEQEFAVVEGQEEDLSIANQNALLKPTNDIIPLIKNSDVVTHIDQSFQIENSLSDPTTDHFENDKCFVSNLEQTKGDNNDGNVGEQEFAVVESQEEDLSIANQNALLKPTNNIIPLIKKSDVAIHIDQNFQIENSLPDPTTDHFENDKCLLNYTTTKVDENINQNHCLSKSIIHCLDNHECSLKDVTDLEHNFNDEYSLTDSLKYDTKNCNSLSSCSINAIDPDHYVNNGIRASEVISHADQSVNENSLLNSPRSGSLTDIDQCIKNEICSPEAIIHSSDDDKYKLKKSDLATVVDQSIQENSNNTTDINPNITNENCSPQPISQNSEKPLTDCLPLFNPKHGKTVLRDLQNIDHSECQINNKKTVEPTLKQEDVYLKILFEKSKTITKKDRDNTAHCYGFAIEEMANYTPMTRSHSQKIKIPYSNIVTTRSNSPKITSRMKNSRVIKASKRTMEVQQGVARTVRVLRNRTVITYSSEN